MKSSVLVFALLIYFGFSEQVEASEKYWLIVFEGSDWCPNCIRLERRVLNDTLFTDYLNSKNIDLLRVDFPQKKRLSEEQKSENEQLAIKYGFDGIFPTIIISRTDSKVFDKIYYQNQSAGDLKAVIDNKLQMLK